MMNNRSWWLANDDGQFWSIMMVSNIFSFCTEISMATSTGKQTWVRCLWTNPQVCSKINVHTKKICANRGNFSVDNAVVQLESLAGASSVTNDTWRTNQLQWQSNTEFCCRADYGLLVFLPGLNLYLYFVSFCCCCSCRCRCRRCCRRCCFVVGKRLVWDLSLGSYQLTESSALVWK